MPTALVDQLDQDAPPGVPARRPRLRALAISAAAILMLFAVRIATASDRRLALPTAAQDFLTLTVSVILESLPFVVLGILLSIAVQVWLPDSLFTRLLPRRALPRRLVISLLGVLLPVCECGNVPLARGLVVKGLTVAESMTFLLAAPIVNPITIITTAQAFGWNEGILVTRVIGGLAVANLVGWIFSRQRDPDRVITERFAAECRMPMTDDHHGYADGGRRGRSVDLFVHEAGIILPALFVGATVAGLVQTIVPRQLLIELGSNPVWSVLAMLILAFVISICSNVDAFFILPFASTFLPGAISTFLIFGPMIDLKMLALMRTTYRVRTLVQLTALVALASVLIGLVVDSVL